MGFHIFSLTNQLSNNIWYINIYDVYYTYKLMANYGRRNTNVTIDLLQNGTLARNLFYLHI